MATVFDGLCASAPQAGAAGPGTAGYSRWPSFRAEWDVFFSSDPGWPMASACLFVAGPWSPAGPAGGPAPVDPLPGVACCRIVRWALPPPP